MYDLLVLTTLDEEKVYAKNMNDYIIQVIS